MAHEVSVSDLNLEIQTGAWVLDVRESDEWVDGHVPTAHHIPLAQVPDNIHKIPQDEKIFVICAAGGRSMSAADFLVSKGYDAVSVAGGTQSWIAGGHEISHDESL